MSLASASLFVRAYVSSSMYDDAHAAGVAILAVAGGLSGLAILALFVVFLTRFSTLRMQNMPYFICLLVANFLQALGTFMNVRWVAERDVEAGHYCSLQGGIKQAGNVGMALWSFVLSVHVFSILFMRLKPAPILRAVVLVGGWIAVVLVVAIGPIAVQTQAKGQYFGPSGYWCWITDAYPREQLFLEYFFEWVSSGLSFILYIGILLRVRGNLIHSKSGWHLRFVPRHMRWQLAINRDWLDSSMLTVAARLLWYPISYIILLLPISFSRLYAFGGDEVPFGVTIIADTLFDLQGFVNVILLYATHRLIPDPTVLPNAAPRKAIDLKSSEATGITPFTLLLSGQPEIAEQTPEAKRHSTAMSREVVSAPYVPTMISHMPPNQRDADTLSVESFDSVDSRTTLTFSAV